jgi:hypothetical protein
LNPRCDAVDVRRDSLTIIGDISGGGSIHTKVHPSAESTPNDELVPHLAALKNAKSH